MKKQLDFCFVINANYIGQFMVTFHSLLKHCADSNCRVHLLHSGLNECQLNDIQDFINRRGAEITFYEIDSSVFEGLPTMRNDLTYSAYNKVLIPYYLSHLGKVLYLDCDIVVNGDIGELFNIDTRTFLSCVSDIRINIKQKKHVSRIISENNFYFNSGVLLFDFKYKDKIIAREMVFKYIKENSSVIRWHDQDILNHFYADSCYLLDEKYNYLTAYKSIKDIFFHGECKYAVILHYANWKPWNDNYIGKAYSKYKEVYEEVSEEKYVSFLKKRKILSQIKLIMKYIIR